MTDLPFDIGIMLGSTNDDIWAENMRAAPAGRALLVFFTHSADRGSTPRKKAQAFFGAMYDDLPPRIVEAMAPYDGRPVEEVKTGMNSILRTLNEERAKDASPLDDLPPPLRALLQGSGVRVLSITPTKDPEDT